MVQAAHYARTYLVRIKHKLFRGFPGGSTKLIVAQQILTQTAAVSAFFLIHNINDLGWPFIGITVVNVFVVHVLLIYCNVLL